MKKSILLLICLALLYPVVAFAGKPVKPPPPVQLVEVTPQMVDSNGKTVGYLIGTNAILMNYSGTDYLAFIKNNDFDTKDIYYYGNYCEGEGYVSAPSAPEDLGWNFPAYFVNDNIFYLYNLDSESPNPRNYQSRKVGYGVADEVACIPYVSIQPTSAFVYTFNQLFDILEEYQPPYKIKFGIQTQ